MHRFNLIDVDKVSHVQSTNFSLCFYVALAIRYFGVCYKGKPLPEIFRVQAASGIVQFSMLAGVVIFPPV